MKFIPVMTKLNFQHAATSLNPRLRTRPVATEEQK